MKMHLTLLATALFMLAGCNSDGPAENAGEEIDEAVQNAGNAVEDACEDVTGNNC